MNNNPLVSIVIPTYNQHEIFLRECLESAINQTYKNIEILLSDNHSTNGTSSIIKKYQDNDNRIRIIKPPVFLSMVEHFIFAYNEANGEYICPVSSDDILYPNIVQELMQPYFEYPDLSFSYSRPAYFNKEVLKAKWTPGKLNTGFYERDKFLKSYLFYRDCSWGGLLVKTSNYHKIGGFSKDKLFTGDVDVIIKLTLLNGGIYSINKPLSAIRLWERDELYERLPYALAENAKIFDNVLSIAKADNNISLIKLAKLAKRNNFAPEVYQLPYRLRFKKKLYEIALREVEIIKENYPNGFFNFIITHRKNVIGLAISVGFLAYSKFKNFFKKKV